MKKHLLFLFVALLPLFAKSIEINNIYYNLNSSDKTAEVTSGDDYSGFISIPSTITYEGVEYKVTSVGISAFSNCNSLIAISLSENITSIGKKAFWKCSSLITVNIPKDSQLTSIGNEAFWSCSSLTAITIPESVKSIDNDAFQYCSNLKEVNICSLEAWCNINFGNYSSNPLDYAENLYLNRELVTNLSIPSNITIIKDNVFRSCLCLTSITIPEGVISIGSGTFSNCSNISSMTIPSSVTSIGSSAFIYCSKLSTIIFTEGSKLTSIGSSAFYGCRSLTSITIPSSVTKIGGDAFRACSNLSTISIPQKVTVIEEGVFAGCSELSTVTLPKGLYAIKKAAFNWCSKLKTITIPTTVEYIYQEAFASCSKLESVKVLTMNPPFAYANTFSDYNIELCVPKEAMSTYQATSPWNQFTSIKSLEGEEMETKVCAIPTISYIEGKVIFTCDTEGATINSTTTANETGNRTNTEFELTPTYTVTAYATKEGYLTSEVATLTLCWIPCTEEHEKDDTNSILTIPSKPVLIQCVDGTITLSGLAAGTEVAVYTTTGTQLATTTATNSTATLATNLEAGSIAIVKMGEHTIKVTIR